MKQLEDKITSITKQINELEQHPNNLATWHYLTGMRDGLITALSMIEPVKQLEWK